MRNIYINKIYMNLYKFEEVRKLEISSAMVKELRIKTGAGMMDCKDALTASDGDFEKAIDFLRKKGLSAATKRSSKAAKDGTDSFIYSHGR